jgi:uncharacterized protein
MNARTVASEMLAAMLNKPLFVALRRPADLTRAAELLEAHLQWAIGAERRGELFASGPFAVEGGQPGANGGMSILRASSEEEVRQLLADDPYVAEGVFKVDIKKWMLMEGGMTVTVRFSDQSSRMH